MAKAKKTETEEIFDAEKMTKEEAMRIIEDVARGKGGKQQSEAAQAWLKINGAGEVYTKYVLTITFEEKPKTAVADIPKLNL